MNPDDTIRNPVDTTSTKNISPYFGLVINNIEHIVANITQKLRVVVAHNITLENIPIRFSIIFN